jgi:glycosyltransferase involved in cell wall biosynthesis
MENRADYGYLRASRLMWNGLVRLVWPIVRRIGSSKLDDRFWHWTLWLRMASNAAWQAWAAARVDADCYVAEDLQSAWAALLAARFRRRPVIYDAHEIESEQGCGEAVRIQRRFLQSLERKLVPQVDRLVVPNHLRAAFFTDRYGLRSEPVVVRNCPPAQSAPVGNGLREALGLSASMRLVLYHGAMIPHRALDNLIRSASYLEEGTALVLVGEQGDYFNQVLAPLREAERLQDRVFFLPFVPPEELAPYVASADLGIVIYENVNLNNYLCAPTKLYEFIMMEVPVAVCDFPEMAGFLREHPVGVSFDPRQPRSIADAVNGFLARGADDMLVVQRALEEARQRYTWERESLQWLKLLESVAH